MFQDVGTTVVRKRLSFLSVTVISLAAIIVTTVVSASGIAIYALKIADGKTDSLVGLVGEAVQSLPEFCKGLPPALADAINDERQPGYRDQLDVSVRLGDREGSRRGRVIIVEVVNRGEETVSLLSMRLVGLDGDGDPVFEQNAWVATPLQIDDDWRGPLLPHETRRIPLFSYGTGGSEEVVAEITDIRVWQAEPAVDAAAAAEKVATTAGL